MAIGAGTSSGMCTRQSAESDVSPSVRAAASRLGESRLKPDSSAPSDTAMKRMAQASTMTKMDPESRRPVETQPVPSMATAVTSR